MNTFISGGCKNGKSLFAQRLAKELSEEKNVPLYYIATMIPTDDEDEARIKRHLAEREGWGFQTLEIGIDIKNIINMNIDRNGVYLLDSVTALLSNEMFLPGGKCNFRAGKKVAEDLNYIMEQLGNMVMVSDYIYSDGRHFDSYTENYRRSLALVDRTLAKKCDQVVEVAYGQRYYYK